MELAIATCVMWCVLFTLISTRFHPPRSTDRRLDSTLAKARSLGVDVFILGHIAPGASHIDWNSMAALGWAGGGWTDYSQRRFYRTVRSYADVVRGQFFGHLHTGSIRLLKCVPGILPDMAKRVVLCGSPPLNLAVRERWALRVRCLE